MLRLFAFGCFALPAHEPKLTRHAVFRSVTCVSAGQVEMANLDFYALGDDLRDLVLFLTSETDVVIYEQSSRFDCEPRQFRSLSELETVFRLGAYRAGYLQLWSPTVMTPPIIRRIDLTGVSGHTFRYSVEGAGLIQLYLDGLKDGIIYHTHFGHWNEAGARKRSMHSADDCDWLALRKLSGQIQRHIQRKFAVARLHARPILRHAFESVGEGDGLWFGPDVHRLDSKHVVALH